MIYALEVNETTNWVKNEYGQLEIKIVFHEIFFITTPFVSLPLPLSFLWFLIALSIPHVKLKDFKLFLSQESTFCKVVIVASPSPFDEAEPYPVGEHTYVEIDDSVFFPG